MVRDHGLLFGDEPTISVSLIHRCALLHIEAWQTCSCQSIYTNRFCRFEEIVDLIQKQLLSSVSLKPRASLESFLF